MILKIGRNEYIVTNKDWILDNGSIYQCMTLRYKVYEPRLHENIAQIPVMSKKLFKDLLKSGKIVEVRNSKLLEKYSGCKIWRFNFDEGNS